MTSAALIKKIYNRFSPFEPLKPGSSRYVNCSKVRGEEDVFRELGKKIINSDRTTYQLYGGHRGAGKSTELLRLEEYLDKNGCLVVYFDADLQDVDPQDADSTDILLACTRHVLRKLQNYAQPETLAKLTQWFQSRVQELKDVAFAEIEVETAQAALDFFSMTIKTVPSSRAAIRKQVDLHGLTLTQILNELITESHNRLSGKDKIVVIADSLDRIELKRLADGSTNLEQIFVNRADQMRQLNCHVIYTLPVSLAYSPAATQLANLYNDPQILPMVKVREKDGAVYAAGLMKLREIIERRIASVLTNGTRLDTATEVFASAELCDRICLMSGGHIRDLIRFVQNAIDWVEDLPITSKAVNRALAQSRNTYHNAVNAEDWSRLAKVAQAKDIKNMDEYRKLLFNRCVLEYCDTDDEGELIRWYDVHPLLRLVPEFKEAVEHVNQKVENS
ncbi:MAG: ATP-binding protein [Cyanobacteria bacterium P01_G01_bin.54]